MCSTSILYIINSIVLEFKIGNDNGHIILDDNTGKIMTVLVKNIVEGKHDFLTTTSYSREGDKH